MVAAHLEKSFQVEKVITLSHEQDRCPVQPQTDFFLIAEILKEEKGKYKHGNPPSGTKPFSSGWTHTASLLSSTRVLGSFQKQLPHHKLSETDNSLWLCQMTPIFPQLRAAGKTEALGISA